MNTLQKISFVCFILVVFIGGVGEISRPKDNLWDYHIELNRDYTITVQGAHTRDTLNDITMLEEYLIQDNI